MTGRSVGGGRGTEVEFGGKARGLRLLPPAWTPPFTAIAAQELAAGEETLAALANNLVNAHGPDLIVRSSAAGETLADRGRWESFMLRRADSAGVVEALAKLWCMGDQQGFRMGAVVQDLRPGQMHGHMSNERRVSKTRNQWQVEIERPQRDGFRHNSQRDAVPPTNRPIAVDRTNYRSAFRRLGNWAATRFRSRVHMEWIIDSETLWIVQLDLEDDMPEAGVDPRSSLPPHIDHVMDRSVDGAQWIHPALPEAFPQYGKVYRTRGFSAVAPGEFPPLYVIRGQETNALLSCDAPAAALRAVVGERLVCRTDLAREKRTEHEGLNLPRTDTCSPDGLVDFIQEKTGEFLAKGVSTADFAFIVHRFIPAVAGAWAEAAPNEPLVLVDALWGLPDGLQYLEHDRYEFNVGMDVVEAEHVTYKDRFLHEEADGAWRLCEVARPLARHACLSREEVSIIAHGTRKLADEEGERLRVMWFVGAKGPPGMARTLPWFSHVPKGASNNSELHLTSNHMLDKGSSLRRLPSVRIETPDDLDLLPHERRLLQIRPEAKFMRNNAFLERVATTAREGGHVIEMLGSGLAHAFYILKEAGAPLVLPSQRHHTRRRKRRAFDKLVRDGIPDKIRAHGEEVVSVTLSGEDRRVALLGKLMEEAQEVAEATNRDDLREELADLFEVVRALVRGEGFAWDEVESVADSKANRLGGFGTSTMLVETAAATTRRAPSSTPKPSVLPSVLRQDGAITIAHRALIGDHVDIAIGPRDVRISMTTEGVVLEDLGETSDDDEQLRLPLSFECKSGPS